MTIQNKSSGSLYWLFDISFLFIIFLYSWFIFQGLVDLSAGGVNINSDISTYISSMVAQVYPEYFKNDFILKNILNVNSFFSLQQFLAEKLTVDNMFALALLKSGALIIFIFYAGYYFLGRFLFYYPTLACALSVLIGITIYMPFGTFWGITNLEPSPKVFFAALWPFLLILSILSWDKYFLRPVVMLLSGLCVFVHALSAITTGLMFFFFFICGQNSLTKTKHIYLLLFSFALYFIPILYFLWPFLTQMNTFSASDMEIFQQLFYLRFGEDYGNIFQGLINIISVNSITLPIFLGALIAWFYIKKNKSTDKDKIFLKMYVYFLLALVCIVFFSIIERIILPLFGVVPMSHEFLSTLCFFIPLSFIMIVYGLYKLANGIYNFFGKLIRVFVLVISLACALIFNHDYLYHAALYSFTDKTGIELPLSWAYMEEAEKIKLKSEMHRQALESLQNTSKVGESVFSDNSDFAIRYFAMRSIPYTFNDGSKVFYGNDLQQAKSWVEYTNIIQKSPLGYLDAWKYSKIPLFMTCSNVDRDAISGLGEIIYENSFCIIAKAYK